MTTGRHLDTGQLIYDLIAIMMACIKHVQAEGQTNTNMERAVGHTIPLLARE